MFLSVQGKDVFVSESSSFLSHALGVTVTFRDALARLPEGWGLGAPPPALGKTSFLRAETQGVGPAPPVGPRPPQAPARSLAECVVTSRGSQTELRALGALEVLYFASALLRRRLLTWRPVRSGSCSAERLLTAASSAAAAMVSPVTVVSERACGRSPPAWRLTAAGQAAGGRGQTLVPWWPVSPGGGR
jgi:hypothetical protein